jgi:hypothetical protein
VKTPYFVGLDLGQRRDHSALAVVEKGAQLLVRHVERMPLGTPYPMVVEKVRMVTQSDALRGRCEAVVDATGVGAPVVEMLRSAGLGCGLAAVTITGGDRETRTGEGWSVPKRDLIAGVQVRLERGDLRIAKGLKDAGSLMRELMDMRMERRESGRVRMEASGAGAHDDLVIALALAVWGASKPEPKPIGFGNIRIPGW